MHTPSECPNFLVRSAVCLYERCVSVRFSVLVFPLILRSRLEVIRPNAVLLALLPAASVPKHTEITRACPVRLATKCTSDIYACGLHSSWWCMSVRGAKMGRRVLSGAHRSPFAYV